MSNTKHTPGAWQTAGSSLVNEFKVALTVRAADDELDTAAVARDIARALNSHDELLAALRNAVGCLEYHYCSEFRKAIDAARAAIAKAEGVQ